MILELMRHGETEQGGGLRGSLDDQLTPVGWQQMREACPASGNWDRIISSPLQRCLRFAEELATRHGLALERVDELRELHFGEWEGRHPADLMLDQADALGRFWADPYAFTPPRGEPVVEFERRILLALEGLQDKYPGEHLLVITHAGVMRLLLARARGLPREALLQVEVGYAQRSVLQRRTDGRLEEV